MVDVGKININLVKQASMTQFRISIIAIVGLFLV